MGVLGGDNAGFPNGRRLGDDVVDIALQVVAGVLVGDEFNVAPNNQLGDGTDYNDHEFLGAFPYVYTPNQGFKHKHHPQNPVSQDVTIKLNELNDSGVSGTATLTPMGDQTKVVLKVDGATGDHPVHIHFGTCGNLQDIAFPLTNIDKNGISETTVDISLNDLLGGEYAINAHLSADQISTYVACGEIVD